MKKLLFPIIGLLMLATACTKEADNYVYNEYYNGDYVVTSYVTVDANSNQWQREREDLTDNTYRTISFYYDWYPTYNEGENVIDYTMIDKSYVIAYWLDNDFDISLPKEFVYYVDDVEYRARFSYMVAEGFVRIVCESLDNNWAALYAFLNENTLYFKMGCHYVTNNAE